MTSQEYIHNILIKSENPLQISHNRLQNNNKYYNKIAINQIINETSFLDSSATISQRIWHIYHNEYRLVPSKFLGLEKGYKYMLEDIPIDLKQWILDNMFDKNGRLDSNKYKDNSEFYMTKKNIFDKIIQDTTFLCEANIPQRLWHIVNNINHIIVCANENCNKVPSFNYTKGYQKFCCRKCSNSNTETINKSISTKTNNVIDGLNSFERANQKRKETCLEKYGIESNMTPAILQKIKETKDENNTCTSNHDIKQKIIDTKLSKTEEEKQLILEKRKETCLGLFGEDNIFKTKEFKQYQLQNKDTIKYNKHIKQKTNYYNRFIKMYKEKDIAVINTLESYLNEDKIEFKCNECNRVFKYDLPIVNGIMHRCTKCNPAPKKGQQQKEVFNFINDNTNKEVLYNNRSIIESKTINNRVYYKELDIYVDNFAIEYDGIMHHSFGKSKHSKFNNYKEENINIHLEKTIECEDKNIHLFRIWDIEWLNPIKQDIWKSILLNKLNSIDNKIYARKCIIKEVSNKEANEFQINNHLQGSNGASVKLGLYYQDELVSLMTFGKSRFNKNIEWELIRFCNKKYTSVIGAASKLLKYFERNYNPVSIISYANRRWSQGNLYSTLGFEFQSDISPNYFYFQEGGELESRIKFQKHKLEKILDEYDSTLSETQNMYNNGYRKIYDCGNKSYIKIYK